LAGGSGRSGDTIIAPYIPEPICIKTGEVPQWYMNAPAHLGRKVKETVCPLAIDLKAILGSI
jgi:hypothetical protein